MRSVRVNLPMPSGKSKRKQRIRKREQVQVKVAPPVPSRRGASYSQAVGIKRNRSARMASKGRPRNRTGNRFPSGAAMRGRRTTRICEDEYIAEVGGSTAFTTTQYPINPGQALTFPWLSKEALLWEKYHFEQLEFYYKPEVSAFAANGQSGKVMLSCDYDASDSPPATKQQVEDTHPHSDAMPYEECYLVLEPSEMYQSSDAKYVRPGGLPGASDIKTYDCGNLFVSTVGNHDTTTIGELRVRYCVVFDVPVLENAAGAPQNNSVSSFQDIGFTAVTSTVQTSAPFATVITNGLNVANTAGLLVPPVGNYLIDWQTCASSTAAITQFTGYLRKNGAAVYGGGVASTDMGAASVATELSMANSAFVTANGTDIFDVRVFIVSGGTCTQASNVTFLAV